jgi:hypothetical protein
MAESMTPVRSEAAASLNAEAPLIDPRLGDIEDDASSPKQKSLLAIAGSLLAEISLPKLCFAVALSILLPGILVGLAPLLLSAWLTSVSQTVMQLAGYYAAIVTLVALLALAYFGGRPLWRRLEANFWSLNALAVQPGYAFWRETLRYVSEHTIGRSSDSKTRARQRALASLGAALVLCVASVLVAFLVWPATRWIGNASDLLRPQHLIVPTLANAAVILSGYLAVASLVWGIADATMPQPIDLPAFDTPDSAPRWRVVHLSDIHEVGEQYGFRIESGRSGPRGNGRFRRIMARLDEIHKKHPLDLILLTGDMTDAGRAAEWAEFDDAVRAYPAIAERMVILPGNHDLNIVDRANPARLDLPFSPTKHMRQMRVLSALDAMQGDRTRRVEASGAAGPTLRDALRPDRDRIAQFADAGGVIRAVRLGKLWNDQFPMILPPAVEDGLGIAILNSNAEAHFSFTNALGFVSFEQVRRLLALLRRHPKARWLIAVHHHVLEYPLSVTAFSERIGTALVNGSWFVRSLKPFASRVVVMHGHRHIDWIGLCGKLKIVSAPSPVMGGRNTRPTYFYIHTFGSGPDGGLALLPPERIDIEGDPAA